MKKKSGVYQYPCCGVNKSSEKTVASWLQKHHVSFHKIDML